MVEEFVLEEIDSAVTDFLKNEIKSKLYYNINLHIKSSTTFDVSIILGESTNAIKIDLSTQQLSNCYRIYFLSSDKPIENQLYHYSCFTTISIYCCVYKFLTSIEQHIFKNLL